MHADIFLTMTVHSDKTQYVTIFKRDDVSHLGEMSQHVAVELVAKPLTVFAFCLLLHMIIQQLRS